MHTEPFFKQFFFPNHDDISTPAGASVSLVQVFGLGMYAYGARYYEPCWCKSVAGMKM